MIAPTRWLRRRAWPALALTSVLAAAAAGCGLPDDGHLQAVEDGDVPYNLLDADEPRSGRGTGDATIPSQVPVVFWLRDDDRLVPSAVTASCADPADEVVRQVLSTLNLSPSPEERTAGLASALPPSARLELVGTVDGVAEIELDPVTLGDAERLPLAVGQLVLSVTSAPGVDGVSLRTSGRSVDVPLPEGALASGPVTADDYAALLPDRLTTGQSTAPSVSADLGCGPAAP